LKIEEIFSKGLLTALLAVLPYFFEFLVEVGIGSKLLHWSFIDIALFSSILAALSPSLVIPGFIFYFFVFIYVHVL
jgi:hypothetical protein